MMNLKKRILPIILSFAICLPLCQVSTFAGSVVDGQASSYSSNERSGWTTEEDSIPSLPLTRGVDESHTLNMSTRALWANKTAATLSDAYGQSVSSIVETSDLITFEFAPPDDLNLYEEHVLKVEYIKPESTLAEDYQTKFTYLWGWKSGYYALGERSGQWSTIKDLTLSVAGLSSKLTVATFAVSVIGIAANYFKGPEQVKAESTVKYYFLNKLTQVKSPQFGYWVPMAEAGIRKDFKRCLIEKVDSDGQSHTVGIKETNGTPSANPTNYDAIKTSAHFNNNQWLINKAIDVFVNNESVYSEAYGLPDVVHQGPNIP